RPPLRVLGASNGPCGDPLYSSGSATRTTVRRPADVGLALTIAILLYPVSRGRSILLRNQSRKFRLPLACPGAAAGARERGRITHPGNRSPAPAPAARRLSSSVCDARGCGRNVSACP